MIDVTLIGRRIVLLRQARGWNQKQLAERAGILQSTLSQVEAGLAAAPSLPTAAALADAFGITLDELVRGTAPAAVEVAA